MELQWNQLVVFENGQKAGTLEGVRWSEKQQAFCLVTDEEDEHGNRIRLYSNTIIEKKQRKRSAFVPSREKCTKQIWPIGETEKAYQIEDGSNGKIGRSSCKEYYKYVAKSICFTDENGNIFAPAWA